MKQFFDKEPTITWSKIYCPICDNPTGKASKCYELKDKAQKKLFDKMMGPVSIYSPSCIYRQDNAWKATINYPFSNPLYDRLFAIPGIEKLIAIKPYTMQVSIGDEFNEEDVKKSINIAYRAFIKEMHTLEVAALKKDIPNVDKTWNGIVFPNGETFTVDKKDPKQSLIVDTLLEKLPETEGIIKPENGK